MEGWAVGFIWNTVTAVTFLGIAVMLAISISRSRQWRANPLAAATFAIFLTCGGGHAVHAVQLIMPALGLPYGAALAARYEYEEWHLMWDGVTAASGVWYWAMRRQFPMLVSGAAVFEDLRARQLRALELNDDVVQGVVRAKLAIELDEREEGARVVDGTLASAKRIVSELMPGGHPR